MFMRSLWASPTACFLLRSLWAGPTACTLALLLAAPAQAQQSLHPYVVLSDGVAADDAKGAFGSPNNPFTALLGAGGLGSSGQPLSVVAAGGAGADYSANQPALPTIGNGFGATGPFANYVLVATIPANPSRAKWRVENPSGGQIAILVDDGTAAAGAAPVHATVWPISGTTAGQQGGSDGDQVIKGRIQIFAPATLSGNAFVAVRQD